MCSVTRDAARPNPDPYDDDEPTVPASTTPPGEPPEGQDPDATEEH